MFALEVMKGNLLLNQYILSLIHGISLYKFGYFKNILLQFFAL